MKKAFLFFMILFYNFSTNAETKMRVKITGEGVDLRMSLNDSSEAKKFYDSLPIEVDLEDYASTEKIFYLPKKLPEIDASQSYEPSAGDVTYYAPWGDIAIFYKSFSKSKGLIYLGKMDNSVDEIKTAPATKVRVEALK